jgi:DNA-binding MurR/RpiR family transcriptional regulator
MACREIRPGSPALGTPLRTCKAGPMSEPVFDEWLALISQRATRSKVALRLSAALAHQPERASYASASDIAVVAGINRAGVTRSAQLLGFSGWPELRDELRARYLASLSILEIAAQHVGQGAGSAAQRSFAADQRALTTSMTQREEPVVLEVARSLARAKTRLALGTGSYAAVAHLLSINATLAGYPMFSLPEGAGATNAIARLGVGDVFIAISFWRTAQTTMQATRYVHRLGARICVITDRAPTPLTEQADWVLKVSAEGGAHFPTMVPAVAVVNALCSELAALDPAHTRRAIEAAEAAWSGTDSFIEPTLRSG